ncbi:MAG: histidine kinase [Bacillota bacterium]
MKTNNAEQEIKELEVRIADLKKRWPAHSLRPAMVKELEELEERLEELKRER